MKPTIYDVAEKANVSIATVSRVLNGNARVTENTRARVMEAVQELAYRPNPVARGLALRATGTLALLIESFSGLYPGMVIGGAEAEAADHDYHLLVYQVNSRDAEQLMQLPGRADGLVVSGSLPHEDYRQALAQQGTPTVVLGHKRPDLGMDGVVPANYAGSYAATEHLIEHGYRRIAHITGDMASGHSADRLRGYEAAMKDHGLEVRSEWVVEGDYTSKSGERAMAELLDLPESPDAVVVGNDLMALGAYLTIDRYGLRVPDNVAIIGFDGLDTGAYVSPPLTTVYQPMEQQGRQAIDLLLWRMSNPDAELREVELPVELLVRGSCGCEVAASASKRASDAA